MFTQNRSIINKRFGKTPYELINKRIPNIKFFRVFDCRRFILNDKEDRGKLSAKADEVVFIGYSKNSAAYREFNKRTKIVNESVMFRSMRMLRRFLNTTIQNPD